ncbi:SDR family oxidoreductase [Gaiella sp.]|uniref:SDR family NAD(P)-dependent oxidoreductase n=1 Tax=Gaiella sp. TaxID=2663207 RepID=UPI0032649CB9
MIAGSRVLVTGAGSGIGRALCEYLAARGAAIAGLDRNGAGLGRTIDELRSRGATTVGLEADVASFDEVNAAIGAAASAFEGLDAAVNVAGIGGYTGDVVETPLEAWEQTVGVNLTGVFHVCRAVIPLLRAAGGGSIVNVSSQYGLVGCLASPAYCASKAGVIGLTRSLAVDHARDRIRANCVCPGPIETPLLYASESQTDVAQREHERTHGRLLAGRPGTTTEVAEAIGYLLEAEFVNGAVLTLDGGWTAG